MFIYSILLHFLAFSNGISGLDSLTPEESDRIAMRMVNDQKLDVRARRISEVVRLREDLTGAVEFSLKRDPNDFLKAQMIGFAGNFRLDECADMLVNAIDFTVKGNPFGVDWTSAWPISKQPAHEALVKIASPAVADALISGIGKTTSDQELKVLCETYVDVLERFTGDRGLAVKWANDRLSSLMRSAHEKQLAHNYSRAIELMSSRTGR